MSPDFDSYIFFMHFSSLPQALNLNFAFAELSNEDKVYQEYKSHIDHWIILKK